MDKELEQTIQDVKDTFEKISPKKRGAFVSDMNKILDEFEEGRKKTKKYM
jgi:TATA-binding protein-associated factor Taf7